MLIQRLGIIVRDATANILRQEAWVTISKRIMAKLPEVPYALFENNAFQAQYGLVIREASQRSITLVDALISTVPIFLGLVGVAVTLFTSAPLMVLALVAIAFPAARIERQFSRAMYALQEHTAPSQLRMDALVNMQVDAPWQRDVRTYRSDLLAREHGQLADAYLNNLKRLTAKFLGLRSAAALVQVLGFAIAIGIAFLLLRTGHLSLTQLVILLPGIPLLSGMINSFIYQYRDLLESLRYAQTLFTFLAAPSSRGGGGAAGWVGDDRGSGLWGRNRSLRRAMAVAGVGATAVSRHATHCPRRAERQPGPHRRTADLRPAERSGAREDHALHHPSL
jgi:ABC-type multidrug transport system fused ATPase/permease subunit